MLKIKGLRASIEGKEVLKGLDLSVRPGEVAAIMGPNGAGKSTLSAVISGHPDYEVLGGEIYLDGSDVLNLNIEERALIGLFIARQYPTEIPGVSMMTFLKTVAESFNAYRGIDNFSIPKFVKEVKDLAKQVGISDEMLKRPLNYGFSGGEKKKSEILQMGLIKPRMCILDETDSGLDIDTLKLVAERINAMRSAERSFLLITHYQRLLDYIVPDTVHILNDGKIERSGDKNLALELEQHGYGHSS